jgi:predicted amidophosphoribosyltransferase
VSPKPFLELTVDSLLVYPSWDTTGVYTAMKEIRRCIKHQVKQSHRQTIDWATKGLAVALSDAESERVLPEECVLVPVPRTSKTDLAHAWPAREIVMALIALDLARRHSISVIRHESVPPSSRAPRGERTPPWRHRETMTALEVPGRPPPHIVLVDDVVTAGSTLCGAAWALRDRYLWAQISAFALARTESGQTINTIDDAIEHARETVRLGSSDGLPRRFLSY